MHSTTCAKRQSGRWLAVIGALVLLVPVLRSAPSQAAMGAPNPAAAPPMMWIVPEGGPADVICRDYSQVLHDATVWNFLRDSDWGQSSLVSSIGYTIGFSGVPSCSTLTSTREQRAVAWARAQLGQTTQPDGNPWNDWCDRFVANAFGQANSGYATAYKHWLSLNGRGLTHPGEQNVPLGALAFYYNSIGGHVMISEGNGLFVSTGPRVYETGLSRIFGSYLGWAYADPEWPGR